ncbi:MAG: TlyA family RNA methyltransferase, partial [Clostridia bacterium]|nr:TlyA family RNA methyltransferase [Clostridia bacterium]
MRIDKYLAENGYVTSRSKASQLIKEGAVKVDGKIADKPSGEVEDGAVIEVDNSSVRYVSRGGLKLEGALDFFNID